MRSRMKTGKDIRRTLLEMAGRRAQPGSGSQSQEMREGRRVYGKTRLCKYLGAVPFVIVGGRATRLYMPERMTLDVDVLVCAADLPAAEAALRSAKCERLGPLTVGGSTWHLPDGDTLDVIALRAPWVAAAIRHAVRDDDGQPCARLRDLVLMKLAAGRVQDLADVSRMLGQASEGDVDETQRAVRRYCPADVADLDSLIALGRLEHHGRPPRHKAR